MSDLPENEVESFAFKAPEPEVKEPVPETTSEAKEATEAEAEPTKPFSVDFAGQLADEAKPALTDHSAEKFKFMPLPSYNYPLLVNCEWRTHYGMEPFHNVNRKEVKTEAELNEDNYHASRYNTHTLGPHGEMFLDRLARGTWATSIKHKDRMIGTRRASVLPTQKIVSGNIAVELSRRINESGSSVEYELPHSGFWVKQRAPKETELINLDFEFSCEKSYVGIKTLGLLLNADSANYVNRLINFAISLMTGCNLANQADGLAKSIKDRLDIRDYGTIIGHLLYTMYPNGFPWQVTCSNPGCSSVRDALLHFERCIKTDFSALTEVQRNILTDKYEAVTDEDLAIYRSEFKLYGKSYFTIPSGIRLYYTFSTFSTYESMSQMWINEIEKEHTIALSQYATEAQRAAFMDQHVQSRALRRYQHFIGKIVLPRDDDEFEVVDPTTIGEILEELSTADIYCYEFENEVNKFIEDNTICIVGYNSSDCSVCKEIPTVEEKYQLEQDGVLQTRFASIVPLAVDRIFFTLLKLKTQALVEMAQYL